MKQKEGRWEQGVGTGGKGEKRVFPLKNYDLKDFLILTNIRFLLSVFEAQWTQAGCYC